MIANRSFRPPRHLRHGQAPNVTPITFAQRRDAIRKQWAQKRITGSEADAQIAQVDADETAHRAEQQSKPVASAADVRHALDQLQIAWAVATDEARALVAASLYSKIRLGPDGTFTDDAIELSPEALAHGLQWGLPEEIATEHLFDDSGWLACPRGLRHAKSVLVPIHARDEWESAAGEDIA